MTVYFVVNLLVLLFPTKPNHSTPSPPWNENLVFLYDSVLCVLFSLFTPRSCNTNKCMSMLIKSTTCDTSRPPAHFPLFWDHKGSVKGDQSAAAVWWNCQETWSRSETGTIPCSRGGVWQFVFHQTNVSLHSMMMMMLLQVFNGRPSCAEEEVTATSGQTLFPSSWFN